MHANGADGNGGGKTEAPVIIEARDVQKSFRIPVHRIDSFKERVVHPFARPDYRVLEALRKVSFDVRRGEFFGIVGRNGSGKSTLLKILASIYRADGGSIRMAGMPAPFIELGVGFNPELSARENVVLNGVMMGLSQREARQRLDSVLDFAELEEFVDLKLKNYSSGMLVRLAFSVMIEAEADILLIDEVLAVGDAAFQQKCRDVFRQMRDSDRTVVLVTHDMTAVQSYCHRAMLLDEGEIRHIGDPEETGRQYMRMNFAKRRISIRGEQGSCVGARSARPRLGCLARGRGWRTDRERGSGRADQADRGDRGPATISRSPAFGVQFNSADGVEVFGLDRELEDTGGTGVVLRRGQRARVSITLDNPLLPGRYTVLCWVAVMRNDEETAHQTMKLLDFVVFGVDGGTGMVAVPGELAVEVEPAPAREAGP